MGDESTIKLNIVNARRMKNSLKDIEVKYLLPLIFIHQVRIKTSQIDSYRKKYQIKT